MKYPNGHEFEHRWLRPAQIQIDPLYQRKLNMNRVDKIVKEFNGDLFNEPKVSFRDGQFWVFNGQHTIAAWRKLNGGNDNPIYCKVYKGMTWLDECEAFIQQNGISVPPTTNEKLGAAYEARRPDVVGMVHGAELVGFKVSFKCNKSNSTIVAVSALFKAFHKLGAEAYIDMLTAIRDAWNYDMDSLTLGIISSMATFYSTYGGNFKREDLVNSLKRVKPFDIIRNGRSATEKNAMARQIVKAYNKGRSSRRLDIEKL